MGASGKVIRQACHINQARGRIVTGCAEQALSVRRSQKARNGKDAATPTCGFDTALHGKMLILQ
jgi:hypothetical protein